MRLRGPGTALSPPPKERRAGLGGTQACLHQLENGDNYIYRHILIPTDGSRLSQHAIAHGVALAKSINAKVTIITVSTPFHTFSVEPEMVTDTPEQYARHTASRAAKYLNFAKDTALAAGVNCNTVHVEHDHPYQAIIDTAARGLCDLIVMASHGRRGVSAVMLGSETVKVLTHGTVPVLVVRASHRAES